MSEQTQTELRQFHQFLAEKLKNGGGDLSPEEVVDLWRLQNPSDENREALHSSIRQALDDMRAGRGMPFDEFVHDFRKRNQITA